jgi:predicted nucleic acid-binding protein
MASCFPCNRAAVNAGSPAAAGTSFAPEPHVLVDAPPAIVLDTNAVLGWLWFDDIRLHPVKAAIERGLVRWIATAGMRAELAAVLARGTLLARRGITGERVLTAFDRWASLRPAPASPGTLVCRDGTDQPFVDLALAEAASWLLTRDKALLALRARARRRHLCIAVPESWPHVGAPARLELRRVAAA